MIKLTLAKTKLTEEEDPVYLATYDRFSDYVLRDSDSGEWYYSFHGEECGLPDFIFMDDAVFEQAYKELNQ